MLLDFIVAHTQTQQELIRNYRFAIIIICIVSPTRHSSVVAAVYKVLLVFQLHDLSYENILTAVLPFVVEVYDIYCLIRNIQRDMVLQLSFEFVSFQRVGWEFQFWQRDIVFLLAILL